MMASALGLWYLEQEFGNTAQAYAPVAAEHRGLDSLESQVEGLNYKAVAIASAGTCDEKAGKLTLATSKGLRSVRCRPPASVQPRRASTP